ncbi:MAG: hypothetical protein ABIJ53_06835 [Verrucomicrobiota bacterium]
MATRRRPDGYGGQAKAKEEETTDPGGVEAICPAFLEWAALDRPIKKREDTCRLNPIAPLRAY